MLKGATDDGSVSILEGVYNAVVALGGIEGLYDSQADESLNVHRCQRSFKHAGGGEELLAGRSIGEIEVGEDGQVVEFVGIGVGVDGVHEVLEHREAVGDKLWVVQVAVEEDLWKIVEHALSDVECMFMVMVVGGRPVRNCGEIGVELEGS